MTKIMTICGTRPELIRLSRIIPKLDEVCEHILVYTGQNFDVRLKDIFFKELNIREPNYTFTAIGTFGQQIGNMFTNLEQVIEKEKPDKCLILGDTNSGLCAIICERMGIPVGHMEAGNRCYNKETPEEINRHIIDNCATINFPYTYRSRENLLQEGFNSKKIYVSGNPIYEVISYYKPYINNNKILETLNIKSKEYVLATLHRAENTNNYDRLDDIISAYELIATEERPVIMSVHPRTHSKLKDLYQHFNPNIKFLEPFGFIDFVALEKNSLCILTDSGTVQEESCLLYVPCVITRNATERPETIEVGSAILAGVKTQNIYDSFKKIIQLNNTWTPPKEYLDLNVSNKIINHFLNKWEN
jgi:UDP-N-acetylglucosamine 2-epimerase (non-hydrolysing)